MAKKVKYVYTFVFVMLILALLLDIITDSEIGYLNIAYFCTFIVLAIFLVARGLIYKIDTNVYFGILLFISPIIQALITFDIRKYYLYCIAIFFVFSIASLVVWLHFKNNFHKKLCLLFLGIMAIFFTPIYLTNLSFWYLIVIAVAWMLTVILVSVLKKQKKHKKFQ